MMSLRPRFTWSVFAVCLAVVCAAMVWMSAAMLRLENSENLAEQQSENERLALWRMDSVIVPIITRESARSHRAFNAVTETNGSFPDPNNPFGPADSRSTSPLLNHSSPYILAHFQFDPNGALSSPQLPGSFAKKPVKPTQENRERLKVTTRLLSDMQKKVSRKELLEIMSIEESVPVIYEDEQLAQMRGPQQQTENNPPTQGVQAFLQQSKMNRDQKNYIESRQRVNVTNNSINGEFSKGNPNTHTDIRSMKAFWVDDMLLLARETRLNGRQYIQGCVLNWPAIREWLQKEIADLLPGSQLLPGAAVSPDDGHLMLASVPVKLVPGEARILMPLGWTPMQLSLLLAWICIALAAVAVAFLLNVTMKLSERRGVFVSAVTHELRTPLTTFRMYTDMLSSGIVTEEKQRSEYLETIRREAERLGHLVENVLSYARLDSSRKRLVRENVSVSELISRLQDTLQQRIQQSDMELVLSVSEDRNEVPHADASAIERILVNLVDNACKYAANAMDKRIHVECSKSDSQVVLQVRDHGPGLNGPEKKRMFQPFSKSDSEAANSAPGVGLGLSLCRKLARSMGGDLVLDVSVTDGACFELRLPAR
jgi:signal transduction histidine kinase